MGATAEEILGFSYPRPRDISGKQVSTFEFGLYNLGKEKTLRVFENILGGFE